MNRFLLPLLVGCLGNDPDAHSYAAGSDPADDPWTNPTWPDTTETTFQPDICAYGHEVRSDDEVEALAVCTVIDGTLDVGGDVTTLSPLVNLTAIHGALHIQNSAIAHLSGLNNLAEVTSVSIDYNEVLQDIDGLNGLISVPQKVIVGHNPALVDALGFVALESVHGWFGIHDNDRLTVVAGFSRLTEVGDLSVMSNDALVDASGLSGLHTVTADASFTQLDDLGAQGFAGLEAVWGDLEFSWNDVTDMAGFSALQSVNGELRIDYNVDLEHLDDLAALRKVGGTVVVEQNVSLTDVSGLGGLETLGGILLFADNPQLCDGDAEDLAAQLGVVVVAQWNRDCLQ